jgi:type II secretory pathway pseudopilin PulG
MRAGRQRGFTLIAVLLVVAATGAGLAAIGHLASHEAQREKEAQLLFVGQQFRQAIAGYYKKEARYPKALGELLEDKRYPMPVRHLRKLYRDPMTGEAQWGLVQAPEGGIMGVHSLAEEAPVKTGNFAGEDRAFQDAAKYSDWRFVFSPTVRR